MKRIVHVTSSLARGGAETLLNQFVTYNNTEFNHIVCYFYDGPIKKELHDAGIATIQIKGLLSLYDPYFWFALYRTIKASKPDLIHSWLWSANFTTRIIARILKVPVINSLHNNVEHDGAIRQYLDRYSYQLADCLVAVSDGVKDSIYKKHGFIPAQLTVIPNGIAQPQGIQGKKRVELNIDEDDFVIGAVGRLVPLKCFDLLIKAFASLSFKSKLLIVGAGPQEQELKELVIQLGLEDRVLFIINEPALPYYGLFDCFCLPCPSEGFGLVILEAVFNKVPVIAIDQGGHPIIKHSKTGLLIRPFDTKELARCIGQLHQNRQYGYNLAHAAYEHIQTTFSLKVMYQNYMTLYKSLL